MNIDKSQIIGKSIKDIPKDILLTIHGDSREYHPVWEAAPKRSIDFLSRCILRCYNTYGATYQISQNKELTIVSDKGRSYTLKSYTKLSDLIIVDYQDTSEDKPMNTKKQQSYQVGDKVKIREDLHKHYNTTLEMRKLAGTTVTITNNKSHVGNGYEFKNYGNKYWMADMFEGLVVEESSQPTIADIKVGTHWERLENFNDYPKGEIITVTKVTEGSVSYCKSRGKNTESFLKAFKPRPDLDKPQPAKIKSKPKTGASKSNTLTSFNDSVVQPEPTKPTKSENTFMSKIKQTALTTVDQNKQATIIASKMEAGRVLNKQIIKQAKPHVPMFFRGYLDTPLAPVILANLVALAGNHTDNKRIKQISELMLLAAADTTIQSFNIDQIIDDVLKNIKLPAGILDDSDE